MNVCFFRDIFCWLAYIQFHLDKGNTKFNISAPLQGNAMDCMNSTPTAENINLFRKQYKELRREDQIRFCWFTVFALSIFEIKKHCATKFCLCWLYFLKKLWTNRFIYFLKQFATLNDEIRKICELDYFR